MFMRLLQVKVKSEELQTIGRFYEERIVTALRSADGCRYACLMQSVHHPDDVISMTLWDSEKDAGAYERSGLFKQLLEDARPYFAESTEWKLQLSKDFTLEYTPEITEPTIKQFAVAATSTETIPAEQKPLRTFLRIVSLHLQPGKFEEFNALYQNEILPALNATRGCRYACLSTPSGETNEAISVTLWNSPADAEAYERDGQFQRLLREVKHTLSDLSLSKLAAERNGLHNVTSDDIAVVGFNLLAGQSF